MDRLEHVWIWFGDKVWWLDFVDWQSSLLCAGRSNRGTLKIRRCYSDHGSEPSHDVVSSNNTSRHKFRLGDLLAREV